MAKNNVNNNSKSQTDNIKKKTEKMHVNSPVGLYLREGVGFDSKYIVVMPNNHTVDVLDKGLKSNTDDYSWAKCAYKDPVTKEKFIGYSVEDYLS